MRPLRELDPLLRTLNSLGVDAADELRFFTRRPNSEELEGATDVEKQLFEFAVGIDHAARELIRHALGAAAKRSVELVNPWLEEAFKGKLDATLELRIAKFAAGGLLERQEAASQQAMLDRIEKLENFAKVALSLVGEMRKTLPTNLKISED